MSSGSPGSEGGIPRAAGEIEKDLIVERYFRSEPRRDAGERQ